MPWTWLSKSSKRQSIFYLSINEERLADWDSASLFVRESPSQVFDLKCAKKIINVYS
jgi:hypothetical protein